MKILILLKNRLFSETLCMALDGTAPAFDAHTSRNCSSIEDFEPDVILADYDFLVNSFHEQWAEGKILLIDTGLAEEEIRKIAHIRKLYGIFPIDGNVQQLKKALSVIQNGQIWIDNEKLKVILHGLDTAKGISLPEKLSSRESRIIELVAEGYRNREIASELFVSEQTIKSHLARIFKKMHVKNRSQLVSMIIRNGLIPSSHNHHDAVSG